MLEESSKEQGRGVGGRCKRKAQEGGRGLDVCGGVGDAKNKVYV